MENHKSFQGQQQFFIGAFEAQIDFDRTKLWPTFEHFVEFRYKQFNKLQKPLNLYSALRENTVSMDGHITEYFARLWAFNFWIGRLFDRILTHGNESCAITERVLSQARLWSRNSNFRLQLQASKFFGSNFNF